MDIDGAERGEQETINGPGLAGSCSGRTTAASVVTAGSVMDGVYSLALLTFELEIHIHCCFHFGKDVQA